MALISDTLQAFCMSKSIRFISISTLFLTCSPETNTITSFVWNLIIISDTTKHLEERRWWVHVCTWSAQVQVLVFIVCVASQTPGVIRQREQILQTGGMCYSPVQSLQPLLTLLKCREMTPDTRGNKHYQTRTHAVYSKHMHACVFVHYLTTFKSLQMMWSWNISLLSTLSISLRGTCTQHISQSESGRHHHSWMFQPIRSTNRKLVTMLQTDCNSSSCLLFEEINLLVW